jgi:hypothetical protein
MKSSIAGGAIGISVTRLTSTSQKRLRRKFFFPQSCYWINIRSATLLVIRTLLRGVANLRAGPVERPLSYVTLCAISNSLNTFSFKSFHVVLLLTDYRLGSIWSLINRFFWDAWTGKGEKVSANQGEWNRSPDLVGGGGARNRATRRRSCHARFLGITIENTPPHAHQSTATSTTTATTMCAPTREAGSRAWQLHWHWLGTRDRDSACATVPRGGSGRRVRSRWIRRTSRPSRVAVGRHATCASRPNREHASLVDVLAAWAADSPTTSLPISIFASSHVDLIPRSNAASSPMYRRLDGFFWTFDQTHTSVCPETATVFKREER